MKKYLFTLCFVINTTVASELSSGFLADTDLQAEINAHSQADRVASFSWDDIMQKPNLQQVKLAPNGLELAYIHKEPMGVSLWRLNIETREQEKLFDSMILTDIHWSADSQMLYLESDHNMAYLEMAGDKQPDIFIKFDAKNKESFYAMDDSIPNHILISREIKTHGKNTQHQLIRVALDGQETILYSGEKRIYDHLFDRDGKLLFIRYPGDNQHHIAYLADQQERIVFSSSVIDKVEMIRFDQASNELILVAYHDTDLISIHAYHIETKVSRILHQDPEQIASLHSVSLDSSTREILTVSYFTDRLKTYAFKHELYDHINFIRESLSESVFIDPSLTANNWLVRQTGATIGHSKYYLYNTINKQLSEVLQQQRNQGLSIEPHQLPKAIPVSYTASDGMLIHGYVMLPKGYDLSQVPLLTHIHGGPFNRSRGGFSTWQYLVNKGYALFIPNFRASKGYGIKYMTAGKAQFSGRVQQDIIDGVNYLLKQGISQPDKLGVFGHSFGGYSVLALMSHYPDFFKAGFASAAPPELFEPLLKLDQKDINRYDGIPLIEALPILMVDLDDENAIEQMNANSPAAKWQNIKNPLMIWAGELDKRVPIVDVKDHASLLYSDNKPVQLFVDRKTGHNFSANDWVSEQAFYFLTEDFFAQHFNKTRPKPNQSIQEYIQKFRVY